MAGYDSDEYMADDADAPRKRQKRFTFKTFAQRVAEVDVDVYHQRAPVRAEPLPGAASFLQEALQRLRELHTTGDFLQAAAALNPLVQTLPQLVHHRDAVMDILLAAVRMDAALSLEPILELIAALARDLHADFLPYLPRVTAALSDLVDSGLDREPELLQLLFACLSSLNRHLVRQLAPDLPAALQRTARLRHHRAEHVRALAAQSTAFLFRHAPASALRAGVRTAFAEHALRPTEARAHGAGLLLAEACLGVSNGLHSRAPAVLRLLLQEPSLKGKAAGRELPGEAVRERAAAVVAVALRRLLEHGRRGRLGALWEAALLEADRRLARLEGGELHGAEGGEARGSAARAVAALAQMAEYSKGGRVDDWAPLFALAARLGALAGSLGVPAGRAEPSQAELSAAVGEPAPAEEGGEGGAPVSLTGEALRLVAAIVAGNPRDPGLSAVERAAPDWAPLLAAAPTREALAFAQGVLRGPGGAIAAQVLAPVLLGALGRAVLADDVERDAALGLLMDTCDALRPQHVAGSGAVPLLLTAQPGGVQLAARVLELAAGGCAAKTGATAAWAGLALLPHACQKPSQALAASDAVLAGGLGAQQLGASKAPADGGAADVDGSLFVYCQALLLKAQTLQLHAPDRLPELAGPTLQLLRSRPDRRTALVAAARVLGTLAALPELEHALSEKTLLELLPHLAPSLSARSQAQRAAALQVLAAFQQPHLPRQGDAPADAPRPRSDLFKRLAQIESQRSSLENGRSAAAALARMRTALEYGQVPPVLVPALVRALLGALHIRFSLLWSPTSQALGMALEKHADVAWPLVLGALRDAQADHLGGTGAGLAPVNPGDEEATPEGQGLRTLEQRLQDRLGDGNNSGWTDASVRLTNLLKALAAAPSAVVEARARDWAPLFLAYLGANSPGRSDELAEEALPGQAEGGAGTEPQAETASGDEEVEVDAARRQSGQSATPSGEKAIRHTDARIGARLWKGPAKEWLSLVGGLSGVRGLYGARSLRSAVARQLLNNDPSVQQAALKCLKEFKLKFLGPHIERLLRLAANETLREELAAFPLAPDADGGILPEHRAGLVGVLVRLLWPRMRKRSGRLGGRGVPGSARAAVLNFLAALPPPELRPLLLLFLHPLDGVLSAPPAQPAANAVAPGAGSEEGGGLFEEPWWAARLGAGDAGWWLAALDARALRGLPARQRVGLLNAAADLLRHLGHRLEAYLPELLAILVAMLEGATHSLPTPSHPKQQREAPDVADNAAKLPDKQPLEQQPPEQEVQDAAPREIMSAEAAAADREVRASALRLLAALWARFPGARANIGLYAPLWPRMFAAAAPLLPRTVIESSSDRAPPLLELAASLAASPVLAPLLADSALDAGKSDDTTPQLRGIDEPWAAERHLGSELLRQAIAVLAAQHASEASRAAALGVVESVLDLGEGLAEPILARHTHALLDALRELVTAAASAARPGQAGQPKRPRPGAKKGKGAGGPSRLDSLRALAVLERLASTCEATHPAMARQLTDALLPILAAPAGGGARRAAAGEAAKLRVLGTLRAVWCQLASSPDAGQFSREDVWRFASELAPLAGSLGGREARAALAACYGALAALLPDLALTAELLTGMNAMSATEVDGLDYDARLGAYARLGQEAWAGMRRAQALPLLHQCLADLRNDADLALRHAAAQALSRLVAAAADSAPEQQAAGEQPAEGAVPAAEDPSTDQEGLVMLVQRTLYAQLKRSVASPSLAVRQEHVELLRRLALAFPAHFADLHSLTDIDPELDFFNNVAHLQLHRRSRAFMRLQRACASGSLSTGAILGVAVPLMQQVIVEGKDAGEGAGHERKEKDRDREANVADAAIGALGAAAGALRWGAYQALLGQFVRIMQRSDGKAVIRAVCTIIDAFHFPLPASAATDAPEQAAAGHVAAAGDADGAAPAPDQACGPDEDAQDNADEAAPAPDQAGGPDADAQEEGADEAALAALAATEAKSAEEAADIQRALVRRVLPALRAQLVAKGGETVRAPVALAVVKLLRHLPKQAARAALPPALQKVANLLRLRLQRLRDDARNVLVAMISELGPEYLRFAIDTLRSALPAKGYMGHVLCYTLHAILAALMQKAEPGALDDILPEVLPILEGELWGDVADEKEAGAFAGSCREAKKLRAADTFQLLAQGTTFRTCIGPLLRPVSERLPEAGSPGVRAKLVALLQAAARGIGANPTAAPADVLLFVHGVLETGMAAEEDAALRARAAAEAVGQATIGGDAAAEEPNKHQHLLVEMALTLLLRGLKKGAIDRSPAMLGMLDGLLPLLVRALRSRHAAVASLALRCLALLVPLPLPGMPAAAPGAGGAMTELLRRAPDSNAPLAQECFKLLAALLRSCASYKPTTGQLRFLLGWAFADVEAAASRVAAFGLLKAVIARKLVVPEVYDLMTRVQQLMVKSHAASVRQQCSGILLQFLLDYPLGSKRLAHHLNFLVANFGYEHETGRETVLSMTQAVLAKFPDALLEEWAPVFFVPLVARLVSDPSPATRATVGATLAALLQRASAPLADRFAACCAQWLRGADARLRRAAAQALGLLAGVEGVRFGRRVPPLLTPLLATLRQQPDQEEDEEGQNEGSRQAWQECYFALALLEKVVDVAPAQVRWTPEAAEDVQDVWRALPGLLSAGHVWVRKAASRLLGHAFADKATGAALLGDEAGAPGRLAFLCYAQLEAEEADEALLGQATKNLVFLAPLLYAADLAAGRVPDVAQQGSAAGVPFDSATDTRAQRKSVASGKALQQGAQGDAQDGPRLDIGEAEDEGPDDGEQEGTPMLTMHGLIRRMARLAGDRQWGRAPARCAALRFAAALASRLGPDRVAPYLPALIAPLYRLTEGAAPAQPDEARDLAEEVLAHLRAVAGADTLLRAYNAARSAVQAQRTERRRQKTVQAAVDPEAAARARMRKQERRATGRKRALDEVHRQRSAGLAVKHKRMRASRTAAA